MKVLIFTITVIASLSFVSCSESTPSCIEEQIATFKMVNQTCPNSTVISYDFQGRTVYVFTQGNCIADGGSNVIDEDCNDVCFLGGIAGFTMCEGVDFAKNARELEVLLKISE